VQHKASTFKGLQTTIHYAQKYTQNARQISRLLVTHLAWSQNC